MIGKTAERNDIGGKKKDHKVDKCFIYKNIYLLCHKSKIKKFIINRYKNNCKQCMFRYQNVKCSPR